MLSCDGRYGYRFGYTSVRNIRTCNQDNPAVAHNAGYGAGNLIEGRIPYQPDDRLVRLIGVESDAEIYAKYKDDLLRYATYLVGADRAEDVVSTVVLRVLSRRRLVDVDKPHAYLMKAVLNESRSVWRRVSTEPLGEADARHLPGEVVETLDALWRLPVRQRAVALLFYWEDRPVAEIAELMDVTEGTIKRHLHNARHRLKRSLG